MLVERAIKNAGRKKKEKEEKERKRKKKKKGEHAGEKIENTKKGFGMAVFMHGCAAGDLKLLPLVVASYGRRRRRVASCSTCFRDRRI